MQTLRILLVSIIALSLVPLSARDSSDSCAFAADQPSSTAEPAAPAAKKHPGFVIEFQAAESPLDKLLAEMNGSTGTKKIEAMSAIINRLVQQQRKGNAKLTGTMRLQIANEGATRKQARSPSPSDAPAAKDAARRSEIERALAQARQRSGERSSGSR